MNPVAILDAAYDEVGDRAPEYGGGFSNHGPMAAEALVHLGRVDEAARWASAYAARLEPFTGADDDRPAVLGELDTYPAWLRAATTEVSGAADWRPVVVDWTTRLVDGAVAAAGHGLLRTAHAVRALTVADTPARRRELARGLAYWAATHQRLPGSPHPTGRARAAEALAALPAPADDSAFFITDALRGLDRVPGFPAAVDALHPDELDLTRLVDAMAPVALAGSVDHAIVYVHALTVPAAVRVLAGVLPADRRPVALAHTWQAMAGLAAAFPVGRPAESAGPVPSADELIDAAVANGDEHAIKVAAAALDEVAHGADERLLVTARALLGRMV